MNPIIKDRMLNQSISWEKFKSQTGAGDKQYELAEEIKGYVVGKTSLFLNANGELVQTAQHIFVDMETLAKLSKGDLLQLPETNKKYPILRCEHIHGPYVDMDFGVVYLK
jgi:hypothetical protein